MKNSFLKKLFITLGVIIFILVLGSFIAVDYLDDYLKDQITSSINENENSPYNIEIGEVHINLVPTNVTLENIKVRTDSVKAEKDGKPKANIDVEKIVFRGASIRKYIFDGEWHADKITLQNPIIDIKYVADSTQGVSSAADTVANFVVAPLTIGVIEILNMTGKYQYNSNSIIELKKLDLEIDDAKWLRPPTLDLARKKYKFLLSS